MDVRALKLLPPTNQMLNRYILRASRLPLGEIDGTDIPAGCYLRYSTCETGRSRQNLEVPSQSAF